MTETSNIRSETTQVSRRRMGGLCGAMAAGATAILAAAPLHTANAAVVYSGPVNLTLNLPPVGQLTNSLGVDLDGNATTDITLFAANSPASGKSSASAGFAIQPGNPGGAVSTQLVTTTTNGERIVAFDADGTVIDGNQTFEVGAGTSNLSFAGGQFSPGATNYFGFEISADGTSEMYGWGQLSISADGKTLTLKDYAFEDSGAPIAIGSAGTAVPEPASLGTIGLAATAMLSRRRRRSAHA